MSGVYHSPQQRIPKPGWFTPSGSIKEHFFIPRVADQGEARSLCMKHTVRYSGVAKPPRFETTTDLNRCCSSCWARLKKLPAGQQL